MELDGVAASKGGFNRTRIDKDNNTSMENNVIIDQWYIIIWKYEQNVVIYATLQTITVSLDLLEYWQPVVYLSAIRKYVIIDNLFYIWT